MSKEYGDYLAHHGVKGQKWGVRRYQNEDGSLKNPKGRQGSGQKKDSPEDIQRRKDTAKKILGIAGGVALAAIAGYAAYKFGGRLKSDMIKQARGIAKNSFDISAKARSTANYHKNEAFDILDKEGLNFDYYNRAGIADAWHRTSVKYYDKGMKYRKTANTATRTKAYINWIKNRGRINVNNI